MRAKSRTLFGVIFLWLVLTLTLAVYPGHAAIPQKINYQGYLTNASGVPIHGTLQIVFSIYDVPAGGTPLWTETQNVIVTQGVYSVNLGEVTPIGLTFNNPYFLGVRVGADPEMTPRIPLTSVGYAFRAKMVDIVGSHTHGGADITTGTVAESFIDGAIARDSEVTVAVGAHSMRTDNPHLTTAAQVGAALSIHTHSGGPGGDIVDGTITNVDISSSAAIVGSKLASDGSVVKSLAAGTNISVVNNNNGSWTVNASGALPIGAVIDWWRPDATFAVPSGFAICDGSVVNDAASPLNGKTLPNLANRFIMGVTNVNNIGTSGGSDTHGHTVDINHDHGAISSSSAGAYTGNTASFNDHTHQWIYEQNDGDWISWNWDGSGEIMHIWDNGIHNDGSGFYPIGTSGSNRGWYTEMSGAHQHQFSVGSHTHSVDVAALGVVNKNTTTVSNVPSYYGLLKIIRIK